MNASLEYTRNSVMTASRTRLVVLMYEGAIRFTEQARFQMKRGAHAACGTAISNAYNVISELKVALDPEAGGAEGRHIAVNLERLYTFMLESLVTANMSRKEEPLTNVLDLLGTLKSAWDQVASAA